MGTAIPLILFVLTVLLVIGAAVLGSWHAGRRLGEPVAVTRRWASATALLLAAWLLVTGGLAAVGALRDFSRMPPPIMLLVASAALLTIALAFSPVGARLSLGLPIAALVGYQAFRIPVEIVLLQLTQAGVVPVQMSLEGRNWDLLSGLSALLVAGLAARGRLPTWGLVLWNIVGLGLLLNIVTVAILSMPLPIRVFANPPANTFITTLPYVWLPVVLVPAALFGHLLVFRQLWQQRTTHRDRRPVDHPLGSVH